MGKTISDSVIGILDAVNTTLQKVDWESVGFSIAQFLSKIDWVGILGEVSVLIANAISTVLRIGISVVAENPAAIAKTLSATLGTIFAVNKVKRIITAIGISGGIKTILTTSIVRGIGAIKNAALATTLATKLSTALSAAGVTGGMVAGLSLSAVAAGAAIGKILTDAIQFEIDSTKLTLPKSYTENAKKAMGSFAKTSERTNYVEETIKKLNQEVATADGSSIRQLANDYYELSQKTNQTKTDIAVMKEYSKQLSDAIPGFSKNVNEQTGAFKGQKEVLDGLVESYSMVAKKQAAYESSVELYKNKQQNTKSIEEAKKNLKSAEENFERQKNILNSLAKSQGRNSDAWKQQNKIVGNAAVQVNSYTNELNNLKKSNKDIEEQIEKNNNIMELADMDYKKVNTSTGKLKKTMDKMGVSGKNQKKVIESLKKELENGNISWNQYKVLVEGSYKSTKDLNKEIKKITGKDIKINAEVKGEENVDGLKQSIDEAPSEKNVLLGAMTKPDFKSSIESFKTSIFGIQTEKKINLKLAGIDKVKEDLRKATSGLSGIDVFANLKLKKDEKKSLEKLVNQNKPIALLTKLGMSQKEINKLYDAKPPGMPQNDWDKSLVLKLANSLKIPGYKVGGFPEDGLFYANHNELVGKFSNGKTAVANNDQIVKGIAEGIGPVVYSAVKQAISEAPKQGSGDVYLDATKVTKEIMGRAEEISRSRGSGWKLA